MHCVYIYVHTYTHEHVDMHVKYTYFSAFYGLNGHEINKGRR